MYNTIEIKARIAARAEGTLADVRTVYAEPWDFVDRNSTGGPAK